jgi:hypothetical protein
MGLINGLKKSGITESTPKSLLLGAGTVYKNLAWTNSTYSLTTDTTFQASKTYYTRSGSAGSYTYTKATVTTGGSVTASTYYEAGGGAWNGTILGATSGGSKLTITPNIVDVDIDGAVVKTKGLTQKQGETGKLAVNLVEMTKGSLKMAIIGTDAVSEATGFDKIVTKSVIEDTDYLDNIAFVGFTSEDKPIVVIMGNALCTSGLEWSGKNKENTVIPVEFESYASFDVNTSQDVLPISIYLKSES